MVSATPLQTDSDRTEASKRKAYADGVRFQLIHKSIVHKHIWVERWSRDFPGGLQGWAELSAANKHMAADPIQIYENPSVEQGEALKLATWLKPVRAAPRNGDGVNEYMGQDRQWMAGLQYLYGPHLPQSDGA